MQSDRNRKKIEAAIQEIESNPNFSLVNPSKDKAYNERCIMMEFVEAFKKDYGVKLSENFEQNKDDPPDFFAHIDGRKVTVELTRLMKSKVMKDRSDAYKNKGVYTEAQRFKDGFWKKDDFIDGIKSLIGTKSKKYSKNDCCIDILVVACDREILTFEDARNWIECLDLEPTLSIKNAFYMSYVAGADYDDKGRWKTIQIFGNF